MYGKDTRPRYTGTIPQRGIAGRKRERRHSDEPEQGRQELSQPQLQTIERAAMGTGTASLGHSQDAPAIHGE